MLDACFHCLAAIAALSGPPAAQPAKSTGFTVGIELPSQVPSRSRSRMRCAIMGIGYAGFYLSNVPHGAA